MMRQPAQSPVSIDTLREQHRLRDFDSPDIYRQALEQAVAVGTRNFVLRFGKDKAEIAIDIDRDELAPLLNLRDRGECPILWINIWDPSKQKDLIAAIGAKYGFSDRLRKSITVWDEFKHAYNEHKRDGHGPRPEARKSHGARPERDLEQGADGQAGGGTAAGGASGGSKQLLTPENVATFKLLQSTLNWTTIDQGDEFICIGANWLHRLPALKDGKPPAHHRLVPPKHWSWFALCKDTLPGPATVLAFHESPVYDDRGPGEEEDRGTWQATELEHMRSNTLRVLRHLSRSISSEDKDNFLQLTDVRRLLLARDTATHQIGVVAEHDRQLDCASNLFYYLFEDYLAAIVILGDTKRTLQQLRDRVFERRRNWKQSYKKDTVIRSLHELSMELRQLRHLCVSYKMLISRMLDTKPAPSDDLNRISPAAADWLSKRARDRFQRLSDRIQLLMLDPIQEYLDEKNSLSNTYFSLIAQNDSEATARLTRSATLLAKLSVFFLPISFITAYFSVEVPGMVDEYTASTYWGVFGVTVGISFLSLFFFSRVLMFISETLDDSVKSGTRRAAALFNRKKSKSEDDDDDED